MTHNVIVTDNPSGGVDLELRCINDEKYVDAKPTGMVCAKWDEGTCKCRIDERAARQARIDARKSP